jgi:hypothetical protein
MAQDATYLQQWYTQMKRMHKKAPGSNEKGVKVASNALTR